MPQDILQHATKLYVCKSVQQKDQFGPIQEVLKNGNKSEPFGSLMHGGVLRNHHLLLLTTKPKVGEKIVLLFKTIDFHQTRCFDISEVNFWKDFFKGSNVSFSITSFTFLKNLNSLGSFLAGDLVLLWHRVSPRNHGRLFQARGIVETFRNKFGLIFQIMKFYRWRKIKYCLFICFCLLREKLRRQSYLLVLIVYICR